MRAVRTGLSLLSIALAVGVSEACSSGPTALAEPAERLEALTATDSRVGVVFDRLVTANVDLCPTTTFSAGWILHSAAPYSDVLRPVAEAQFGLQGDLPGILAVVPGGPAEQAGLAPGDLILGLNGAALPDGGAKHRPSYEGYAENMRRLEQALENKQGDLTVLSAGQIREVALSGRRACSYLVQVDPDGRRYARADGRRVFISTAMAAQAESEDELAMVLAHELAHNILQHYQQGAALRNLPWRGGAAERDADRLALYLVVRAAYREEDAIAFFRRYGEAHWAARQVQWGHSSMPERYQALLRIRAEIARQRSAKLPLIPPIAAEKPSEP